MSARNGNNPLEELQQRIAAMEELLADTKKELAERLEKEEQGPPRISMDWIDITQSKSYEHRIFYAKFRAETNQREKPWRIRIRPSFLRELNGDLCPQQDFYFSSEHDIKRAVMFGIHMYRLGALHAGNGDAFAGAWPDNFDPNTPATRTAEEMTDETED